MADLTRGIDTGELGSKMFRFMEELFPVCRSITGDGIRETLDRISNRIPLELHDVPTGTEVFDWTIPKEWNIRQAFIKDPNGRSVIDLRDHNLHVVSYSLPVNGRMPLSQLRKHIHTLPDQPDLIPYRTSYYSKTWGFCMQHTLLQQLAEGEYEVLIDSSESASCRVRAKRRCWSRVTAAIRRSPTTTYPGSLWPQNWLNIS
jgi:aminopeptidase-like protein